VDPTPSEAQNERRSMRTGHTETKSAKNILDDSVSPKAGGEYRLSSRSIKEHSKRRIHLKGKFRVSVGSLGMGVFF